VRREEKLTVTSKGIKVHVGDVFQIPVSKDCSGFGQILADDEGILLMAIFDRRAGSDKLPSLETIVSSDLLFIANSFDTRISRGYWSIIGNLTPDRARIPLPNYKVGRGGAEMYVENYEANKTRVATPEELALLDLRSSWSPKVLEDALKAHWGSGPWNDHYNRLRAENALRSCKVQIESSQYKNIQTAESERAAHQEHQPRARSIEEIIAGHMARDASMRRIFSQKKVDPSEPRVIECQFWIPSKEDADRLAQALKNLGFEILKQHPMAIAGKPEQWNLEAATRQSIDQTMSREFVEKLVRIADFNHGGYDGWGTRIK
jgi:hypothetical protein